MMEGPAVEYDDASLPRGPFRECESDETAGGVARMDGVVINGRMRRRELISLGVAKRRRD